MRSTLNSVTDDDAVGESAHTSDESESACPMRFSERRQFSVTGHGDVCRVLADPATFSSRVSQHPAIPNNMDEPEHRHYRAVIDRYFDQAAMDAFTPECRHLSADIFDRLPKAGVVEVMETLAYPFAIQAQCGFLGWPASIHATLARWIKRKWEASAAGEHSALSSIALEFDGAVRALLNQKRMLGERNADDPTTRLMRETVLGKPLTDSQIVSILRNWTVGELGTIAASVGIILDYLARHPAVQTMLRNQPGLIAAANDEILRIKGPLLTSRRVVTKPVTLGEIPLEKDDGITIMWAAANRDRSVFGDPDEFRLDRAPALNLLYGAGIHACPGAPLARLELRILVETLFEKSDAITPVKDTPPLPADFPAAGYRTAHLYIQR